MLSRFLSYPQGVIHVVAALLLACASTSALGYARPLSAETALPARASLAPTPSSENVCASPSRAKEKCSVPPNCASSLPYDAWGNVIEEQSLDASLNSNPNRIGFTGYQLDHETSKEAGANGKLGDVRYYAKARYYGAGRGSFLSVDPWSGDQGNPISYNKYLYAYANPGSYVDPDGRISSLVELQAWFSRQKTESLAVAQGFNAAQGDAPLYAKPGLALGWAMGGIGYMTGAAGESIAGIANVGANAAVIAADATGAALGSENAFTPLAADARAEIDAFVEQTGPGVLALQADPVKVSVAATAGLATGYADRINRAMAGDTQATFDLASELNPRRILDRAQSSILRAADDVKVGAPKSVTMGEGSGGGPAAQIVQEPGRAPSGPYRGGPHSETKLPRGDGLESHHMPAKSVSGLGIEEGPAIKTDPMDHGLTSSHGKRRLESAEYRAEIKAMIDNGRMRDAMATEIRDVRRAAGEGSGDRTKYNEAMREMLEYAKQQGWLEKGN